VGVFALHDARLDEVPDAVVAAAAGQDGEVGRLLGVLDPLLYPCKRLRKGNNKAECGVGGVGSERRCGQASSRLRCS